MRNPKNVCQDHNLYSYQAQKGAEVMMRAITEDLLAILDTPDVTPLHDRVREYLKTYRMNP